MPRSQPLPDFIEEVTRIIESAKEKAVVMRAMGACAFTLHGQKFLHLYSAMKRQLTDIDLMTYGKYDRNKIVSLLTELGYEADKKYLTLFGERRHIYYDKVNNRVLDVFFDKLEMSHTIDLSKRLELDFPTITLADLFLEKMQIVKINEKDIQDTIVLLREHNLGSKEEETVNVEYIASLLAKDWGFYYTVTMNLGKVKEFLQHYKFLTDEDRLDVSEKVDSILQRLDTEPKSLSWKMRARIGPKVKWYNDVEATVRGAR